jgi:serine/threonine protein kinase
MSASSPPVRGLVAGKYEVIDLIGRGGMGSVWQGRHASLGTRVAIKFVDPEHAQSHEARSRFVTEARAAATIQSRHAIQIYDHGVTEDGRPFIVMELLAGEPLDRRIQRVVRMPLGDVARILGQVCRALQRAHDAGIVHRDLKPENIFLVRSPDDDEETAKVLDFGIAKIMAAPGALAATSSTKTGAVLGTPYYMSPEQARGLRTIDHRTDLWSLGVIAYKCLTGVLPFEGQSVGDLLVNICTSPVPTPSMAVPALPKAFDAWFFRALEREPDRRFSQASELASALALAAGLGTTRPSTSQDHLVVPTPVTEEPETAAGVTGSGVITSAPFASPTRRHPRRALAVAITAGLVGGTLGVLGVLKTVSVPRATGAMGVDSAASSAPSRPVAPAASVSAAPPASAVASSSATVGSLTLAPIATPYVAPLGSVRPPPRPTPSARSTSTAMPPVVLKPAPAKPSPTGADPGY